MGSTHPDSIILLACPLLQNPTDGRVDLTEGTKFNSVARFSCNEGYNVFGPSTMTCLATGEWCCARPTCKKGGMHWCNLYCNKIINVITIVMTTFNVTKPLM